MPAPVPSPSSSTTAVATTLAANPASTTPATPATSTPAQNHQNAKWQSFKSLVHSAGIVQTSMGLVGLVLAIVGIPWAMRTYNMAQWTELKDFRDDCRSTLASGAALSKACGEALGKELEPPPYAPVHFSRLGKRDSLSAMAVEGSYMVVFEMWRFLGAWAELLHRVIQIFSKIQKLPSLLLHPWTFDSILLLLLTYHNFRYAMDKSYTALFIVIILIHHLILWPIWCDNCHGLLWKLITQASDTACCVFIFAHMERHKQTYQRLPDPNNFGIYGWNLMIKAMIGLELGYEVLLLLDGFRRSYEIFCILFVIALLFHVSAHYSLFASRGYDPILIFRNHLLVLSVLAMELCLVINFGGGMLLFGELLIMAFYGGIIWELYIIFRRSSLLYRISRESGHL